MKRRLSLSALLLLLISSAGMAQTYTLSNALNGNAQYATTCSGTFVDDGGAGGNYTNGVDASYTFYPAVAGQYTCLTFTAFNTQLISDYLAIYDGPGGPLIAQYSGAAGAFTVTASASNSSRGLTCRFHANATTVAAGWSATISCVGVAGAAPAFTPNLQDCQQGGGVTICNNSNLTANSSGIGNINDLPNPMNGCLSGENQSSWYYFSPSASGTIGFTIAPSNGADDYDFALWGPYTNVQCPLNNSQQPLRCSYSGLGGNTGCGNGAVDVSEGAGGDKWVSTFPVLVGEVYVLCIDNFVASGNPFTLTWSLAGGADLNCTVLPVEIISVWGTEQVDHNLIEWQTASEKNNDYFSIERSVNGGEWDSVGVVDGAENSTQILDYEFRDYDVQEGISYYRLRQHDFDGRTTTSQIMYVVRTAQSGGISSVYPVPSTGGVSFEYNTVVETSITVEIDAADGRLVQRNEQVLGVGRNVIDIDLAGEPDGVYNIRVTDKNTGKVSIKRIVIAAQK